MLMFLMKLRHNPPDGDIVHRFGVHPSLVSRNSKMLCLITLQSYVWSHRGVLRLTMKFFRRYRLLRDIYGKANQSHSPSTGMEQL